MQPRHTLTGLVITPDIRDINAATSFFRIIAGNLATRNGDISAVIGSKPSAAMTTPTIITAKSGIAIVRNVTTRNGHTTARSQDATAKAVDRIACVVAGNYATSHLDCRMTLSRFVIIRLGGINVVLCKNASTARSSIAGDYTIGYSKSRPSAFTI